MPVLPRVAAKKASDVCRNYAVHKDVQALLSDDLTPAQFLDALQARGFYGPAIEFLVRALPKREAIWWACLCLGVVGRSMLPESELAALRASVHWVEAPDEKNRQAAYPLASMTTAAGSVAQAVYWSGGSMGPPGSSIKVAPTPEMLAQTVYGAILKASSLQPGTPELHRQFVSLGLDIAQGKHLWKN